MNVQYIMCFLFLALISYPQKVCMAKENGGKEGKGKIEKRLGEGGVEGGRNENSHETHILRGRTFLLWRDTSQGFPV
jgi:hypothetical protein